MARAAAVNVKFKMFLDRPGVMASLGRWKTSILARTGGYGRKTMRNLFRPPLKAKRNRTVQWQGRNYVVPLQGLVVDAITGRPVRTEEAKEIRRAFWAVKKGRGAGMPPRRGPTDLLRKLTLFQLDSRAESVVIGPYPFKNQPQLVGAVSVPELLDKGGGEYIRGELVHYEPRPYVERCLNPTLKFMTQIIERNPVHSARVRSVRTA